MKIPQLVGILNVTPDSFSDGYLSVSAATKHYEQLLADGADVIDIGAESTRPGATPLSPEEEWSRLAPVLASILPTAKNVPISIDTRHAATAARALDVGVSIINDVGWLYDAAMRQLLGQTTGRIVVMHALDIPANPAHCWPPETDVVALLLEWKRQVMQQAKADSIDPARLIFDPGIGFGKTAAQSLAIMAHASALVESGGEWLFGHSRKSCLRIVHDVPAAERDVVTRSFSAQLAAYGVQFLRVHDVAGHRAMFRQLCM